MDSEEDTFDEIDSSWALAVFVEELESSQSFIVKDSTIVSALLSKLISRISLKFDWTEFDLFDTERNRWLLPRFTNLSNFQLNADSKIRFVRRYHMMEVQLPDLQVRRLNLDLSMTVYELTSTICQKMGIKHHEELSIQCRQRWATAPRRSKNILKRLQSVGPPVSRHLSHQSISCGDSLSGTGTRRNRPGTVAPSTIGRQHSFFRSFSSLAGGTTKSLMRATSTTRHLSSAQPGSPRSQCSDVNSIPMMGITGADSDYFDSFGHRKLASSPCKSFSQALLESDVVQINSHQDRCTIVPHWLAADSSLMQQRFEDFDNWLLMLRFKYHNYYGLDINSSNNNKSGCVFEEIRINQIFQQARWSLLAGETDCTEEEATVMGGLLLHITEYSDEDKEEPTDLFDSRISLDTEIDSLLDKLAWDLGVDPDYKPTGSDSQVPTNDSSKRETVSGEVRVVWSPRRFYERYRRCQAHMRPDRIHLESRRTHKFVQDVPLFGNDVIFRVQRHEKKKGRVVERFMMEVVRLGSKNNESWQRVRLRVGDGASLVRWVAAAKLAARGREFSEPGLLRPEMKMISALVDLRLTNQPLVATEEPVSSSSKKIDLDDLVGPRFNRRPWRRKGMTASVLQCRQSFRQYGKVQAQLTFIHCWLSLSRAGMRYYPVVLVNEVGAATATTAGTGEPLVQLWSVGIGYDRIELAEHQTGRLTQLWTLSQLADWATNWETLHSVLHFRDDSSSPGLELRFVAHVDCQNFHEYLGGYLFVMMRNSERFNDLGPATFHRLTSRNV